MKRNFFRSGVFLLVAATLAYVVVIAYLGTFSRYMSDDYCEAVSTRSSSPLTAVITRYEAGDWRAANRYSNLLFVGITESLLGWRNIAIIPALMVILWGVGLAVLVRQIRIAAGIEWSILMDVFWGGLLAFITILEAPNRFQILYWRSSMATHFAPLVFLNFLVAAMLSRIQKKPKDAVSAWFALFVFLASFIIGGFSEPPVTVMVTSSALMISYVWFFVKNDSRKPWLLLSGSMFMGAVSALAVMAASPAVSKLGADAPSFTEWIQRTVEYTYFFQIDTVKTLPIPVLFSVLCPALFVFLTVRQKEDFQLRASLKFAIALPVILFILIAAGFSTSAYGQSFPVERARFFAHYLMTITFVLEGALLGIWLSQIKLRLLNAATFEYAAMLLLFIMAAYPCRAVLQALQDVPEYRTRAQEWDRRDAHIYALREHGQTDLVIPQFGGIYDVKELDNLPTHWVNRCAADYYEVNSISAVTIHGADALEEYYNDFGDRP